jgi:N-acetylmuramoyl-L-alanine amidase
MTDLSTPIASVVGAKTGALLKSEFEIESGSDSAFNSFDFNTPEGRAIAQVYAKRYQEKSDRLASLVNDEIDKTNRPALGVNQRQKGIWVLQATNMPAILIETGFINNVEDERYLNSPKGQQELAESITNAVIRYKNQIENNNHSSN